MKFTKMQATANDFILVKEFNFEESVKQDIIEKICERRFNIGADGVLYPEKSEVADIKMNYYNSDGSRGEMCGNGIRCFSKFVYENGMVSKEKFAVETDAGIKNIELKFDGEGKIDFILVDMGKAYFSSNDIPCSILKEEILEETIEVKGEEFVISSVLVGVPHTIIIVDDFMEDSKLNKIGRSIENLDIFPRKTNVNFVKIIDDENIEIKTWERGAGRTLGCGTGACSAVVITNRLGYTKKEASVKSEGGEISVKIDENNNIKMGGKAITVFHGEIELLK